MAICGIPSLALCIAFVFLPESPKFLIATGKATEALAVIKKVYEINTGNPSDSFPVT